MNKLGFLSINWKVSNKVAVGLFWFKDNELLHYEIDFSLIKKVAKLNNSKEFLNISDFAFDFFTDIKRTKKIVTSDFWEETRQHQNGVIQYSPLTKIAHYDFSVEVFNSLKSVYI